jgi:hypothetical protein
LYHVLPLAQAAASGCAVILEQRKGRTMHRLLVAVSTVTVVSFASVGFAQPPASPPGQARKATIVHPDHQDVTPPLRDMKRIPPGEQKEETPHAPMPLRGGPKSSPGPEDGALQTYAPGAHAIQGPNGFEGVGNNDGVLPPDTNGDVGPNHYIQWVNLTFAIYNKNGSLAMAPASGRTLWQGFGGACETDNDGDPIVLYDEAANRWFMSQFALPNYPKGPYYQCIAVSRTGDPTGSWARYSYSFSKMNDYPKFGVWTDGYYMSTNQFVNGISWGGEGVAVFERDKMLAADPTARMVYFDMVNDTSLGGMLPADIDGAAPPAGSPEYYIQFDDTPTELQLWQFHVDWANTANSTFTRKALLATSSFNSNMCNGSRNCIPQPGTTVKIDAIADRMMYRLQYRNFGDHESLVTNHTVNVGSNRGGVRWYEIRSPGTTPVLYQQGTFAPSDTLNRWMGSVAMDKDGNLGVGYSVSNATIFPGIRFSGRLAGDALNTLTVTESDLQTGSGSQTHSSGRWGDYSMLAVDPTDGCTFWYTTEYYTSGATSAGWRTNVGSFHLGSCGSGPVPPNAPSGLTATAASSSQINLQWVDNSTDETSFSIERCSGANCSNFAQIGSKPAGTITFSDTGLAASTSYSYRVQALNGSLASAYSNTATTTTQGTQPPPDTTHVWVTGLTGSKSSIGKAQWRATAAISAGNDAGAKSGVTVTGRWSDGTTGSCVTTTSGSCSIQSAKLSTKTVSTTFTITNLQSSTLQYSATKNVANSVTITKP